MDGNQLILERKFSENREGQHVDILAEVLIRCPHHHVCRSAVFGQTFITNAPLTEGHSTFALLGAVFRKDGRHPWLMVDPGTQTIQHANIDMMQFDQVIEACAGIGAVSTALPFCNAQASVYIDSNEKFCDWLRTKTTAPVIQGDIGNPQVIKAVSDLTSGRPQPLNAGVSCQPFSVLGDQRQGFDPRSKSFPALLKMGYYLRAPLITMECTKEALDSEWAQRQLREFIQCTGYKLHQTHLHLHTTWPAFRTRWWAILSHPSLGVQGIPQMPKLSFCPAVMHLMQLQPHLHPTDQQQLDLDRYELRHFHTQPNGIAASVLNTAKPMPTATHSWGSQLGPCACGCRDQGFSMGRLHDKGLYGVLVPLGTTVKSGDNLWHGMRHLHPQEVAIFNGLDPRYVENQGQFPLKLELAGVGQLASPLQGAWVFSNVLFQIAKAGYPIEAEAPRHVIANMCQELLTARNVTWPGVHHTRFMQAFENELMKLDKPVDESPTIMNHAMQSDHASDTPDHAHEPHLQPQDSIQNDHGTPHVENTHISVQHDHTTVPLVQDVHQGHTEHGPSVENHQAGYSQSGSPAAHALSGVSVEAASVGQSHQGEQLGSTHASVYIDEHRLSNRSDVLTRPAHASVQPSASEGSSDSDRLQSERPDDSPRVHVQTPSCIGHVYHTNGAVVTFFNIHNSDKSSPDDLHRDASATLCSANPEAHAELDPLQQHDPWNPPMCFQAMPSGTPVPVGPTPPHASIGHQPMQPSSEVPHHDPSATVARASSGAYAQPDSLQPINPVHPPMCFQAMPSGTPVPVGPAQPQMTEQDKIHKIPEEERSSEKFVGQSKHSHQPEDDSYRRSIKECTNRPITESNALQPKEPSQLFGSFSCSDTAKAHDEHASLPPLTSFIATSQREQLHDIGATLLSTEPEAHVEPDSLQQHDPLNPPMSFQAMPSGTPVLVGPAPPQETFGHQPMQSSSEMPHHDLSATFHRASSAARTQPESLRPHIPVNPPMFFQAMPSGTPVPVGPTQPHVNHHEMIPAQQQLTTADNSNCLRHAMPAKQSFSHPHLIQSSSDEQPQNGATFLTTTAEAHERPDSEPSPGTTNTPTTTKTDTLFRAANEECMQQQAQMEYELDLSFQSEIRDENTSRKRKQDCEHSHNFANQQTNKHAKHDDATYHPASTPAAAQPSTDAPTVEVWIAHPGHTLYSIAAPQSATIGQIVQAEAKLHDLPPPTKPLTAVGTDIPVYKAPHPGQIIILADGQHFRPEKCPCIRSQSPPDLAGLSREAALWRQRGWVASDEMAFYMSMLQVQKFAATTEPLVFLDSSDDATILAEWIFQATSETTEAKTFTACLHRNHWLPLSVEVQDESILFCTTEVDAAVIRPMLEAKFGHEVELRTTNTKKVFNADCGFQTLAWILNRAVGDASNTPMYVEEAVKWRTLFAQHIRNMGDHTTIVQYLPLGGMAEQHIQEVANLLTQHGVAIDRVPTVVQQLVKNLGHMSIKAAMGSARPWADIKTKASACKPPLQLVLASELQAKIAERLQTGKPMGSRKNKAPKKAVADQWITPMASQVQIPPGIFQQHDGALLQQISLNEEIQTKQQGVVVLNITDAKPYFNLQAPLSKAGLAMLVLEFQDETLPQHQVVRFPANCPETQEPMILTAALVQLGAQPVTRHLPPQPTGIEQIETKVVRVVLFRDQYPHAWEPIVSKPVKTMLALEHFATLPQHDILDVWDRQYMNKQYQRVKPDQAEVFSVVFRLPAPRAVQLMSANSVAGLYFEPRTQSGRAPSPSHRIVWLPKLTFADAVVAKQATSTSTTIARAGDRFGLRVATDLAPEVHKQHRPDVTYLDGSATKQFRISPLPFGTTKKSLQKVIDSWEWSARASHTQGLTTDKQGLVWVAQAVQPPPYWVFTMQHGDVLINEHTTTKTASAQPIGAPVASAKTLKHLTATSNTHQNRDGPALTDPLQANDPWASAYRAQAKHAAPSASQLASIESNVQKKVLAAVQDQIASTKQPSDMDIDANQDQRVTMLEQQVQSLTTNMQQLTGSMTEFKNQQTKHNNQVAHQVMTLQQQADQQQNSMQQLLDQKLEEQMNRTHVGTGFVTNLPSRRLLRQCSEDEWASAREVRRFERTLQAELTAKAKRNRAINPNKIFRDFAKPAAAPVSVLLESRAANIVEVNHEEQSLTLDCSPDFGEGEILGPHGHFQPIAMCEDVVWPESTEQFVPGQQLRQEHFIGQLEELFQKFTAEWKQRWDKHRDVPSETWRPLQDFFCSAHPPGRAQLYQPITVQQWKAAIKRKKPRAAQGPDGWCRRDLLQLPDDLTQAILDVITKVETGQATWPKQWLCGIVHSLEKCEGAAKVSNYRPITIFSLIYRTWASLRSREMLRHLLPDMPGECFGNLPSRCTTNMWMALQTTLEHDHASGFCSCGAVLDIVKCFNHLPRTPLLAVLSHMGISKPVIHAWSQALQHMERRFAIRGSVSPPVSSTTGFAEGCSLSVVSMLAANQLIDLWMRHKVPTIRTLSFVDNLELLGRDPERLMYATNQLKRILTLMDLQIDDGKTYLWSTDGQHRKQFIQAGFNVRTAARDVGAHMQYTRQTTNFTITAKIDTFKERWKLLAISPAPYLQKLRALRSVAWQSTLHGVASVHLGDTWFDDLRTGALRALGEHKKGCAPAIHLSLIEHPSFDPGFHALNLTVMQCRQYMSLEQCGPQFSALSQNLARQRPEVGPSAVVLHRLQQVFWSWDDHGFFRDALGHPVDLWNTPIQELTTRLGEAWQYKISSEMSCRKTFAGLHQTNARLTMEAMTTQPRDRAIMRSALNGTFFTANHLKHRTEPSDTNCKLCGQPDSLFHRNWTCPALDKCRAHVPQEMRQALLAMPPATYLQGWIPEPTALSAYRHMLDGLLAYHDMMVAPLPAKATEPVHMFTDGTCLRPKDKFARLCAWGVVAADPTDMWSFQAIAAGPLRGRHQTVLRAEMVAAIAAVTAAVQSQSQFCLWSDNRRVVQLMQQMLMEPDRQWSMKVCNHDLIVDLANVLRQAGSLGQGVFKVASHQKCQNDTPAAERWSFAGNDAADKLAAQALEAWPHVLTCWKLLCQQLDFLRSHRDALHAMLLNIGVECLLKNPNNYFRQSVHRHHAQQLVMTDWKFPSPLPAAAKPYRIPELEDMMQWITGLHDDTLPVQRWSWWQLCIDASINIRNFGPWYKTNAKQWYGGTLQPPEPFLKRARWLAQFLTRLAKACDMNLPTELTSASGSHISFWTTTLPVQVPVARTDAVDDWLRFLCVLHLCRVGEAFSCALIQFPRGCSPKDPLWATVAVRESVPWRSLARHPDVYQKQTHLVGVKLTTAELKLLKLEGRVVAEGITDGKVQKGWRLCPGGDLPKVEKKSEFAAQLLGIREDPGLGEPDSFAAALSSLVAKSSEASDTAVTLFFEKTTKGELAAMVPQHRALMVDLSFQARGEAEFLKDVIEVPRQPHVQGEAMLIGVSLARLAVAKEVPLQPSEATMALHQATKALQSSPEILEQLSSTPDEWLWTNSRSFYRVLCNEAVGDVVDAWRALSSEERVTSDSEYFTDQFLSLSCYGELIDSVNAKCMSIEGPLLARQVLVSFGSKEPSLRLWEALPVLSKPGRLAAQLWAMLRFDESLKSFGEARHALADGFFRCYSQEAPGGKKGTAELRLRLHLLLVLLELIWLRRQAFGDAVDHDLCPGFPAEVGLREVLRQEVLLAATCWKRQQSEKDTAGKPHASSPRKA
eukprot:s1304_g3.t1